MNDIEQQTIEQLETRVAELERTIRILKNRPIVSPTYLVSDNLLKRAFAVYGHFLLAQLIIAVPLYCIFFLLASAYSFY